MTNESNFILYLTLFTTLQHESMLDFWVFFRASEFPWVSNMFKHRQTVQRSRVHCTLDFWIFVWASNFLEFFARTTSKLFKRRQTVQRSTVHRVWQTSSRNSRYSFPSDLFLRVESLAPSNFNEHTTRSVFITVLDRGICKLDLRGV